MEVFVQQQKREKKQFLLSDNSEANELVRERAEMEEKCAAIGVGKRVKKLQAIVVNF